LSQCAKIPAPITNGIIMGPRDIYGEELDKLTDLLGQLGINDLDLLSTNIHHSAEQFGISDKEAQTALLSRAESLRRGLVWARVEIQAVLERVRAAADASDIESKFARKLASRNTKEGVESK
jgi:hypothetical protein